MRRIEIAQPILSSLPREKDERLIEAQNLNPSIDCYTYVFKIVEGGTWTRADESDFLESPMRFLESRGYIEVEEPIEGDIVGYAHDTASQAHPAADATDEAAFATARRASAPYFAHVGIYSTDGKVVSKFGRLGDLYRHDLEEILPMYGSQVYFFRRTSSQDL